MYQQRIDGIKQSLDNLSTIYDKHDQELVDEVTAMNDLLSKKEKENRELQNRNNMLEINNKSHDKENARIGFAGGVFGVIVGVILTFIFSSYAEAQQNHFDPNNRAFERAQEGKQFQRAWEQHYGGKRSNKEWHDKKRIDGLQPVVSAIDYATRNLYIFNYETDAMITIAQSDIQGWNMDLPLQHTAISSDGKRFWVSTDATVNEPPRVWLLEVKEIDWENNTAKLKVESEIEVGGIGEPATLPNIEPVTGSTQEIADWIRPSMTQVHAQTFLPFSDFMYMTEYTTDKVHVFKNGKNQMELVNTIQMPGWTDQTHGIIFNAAGSVGLGTGYFYDNNLIDVYKPNRQNGELTQVGQIELAIDVDGQKFVAPMTHLVAWIDSRYAVVATMQHDRTSLTPADVDGFIGPSVWLLDSTELTATMIIDKADNSGDAGVFRSASDVAVVNGKLYIAEEDSVRQQNVNNARDGYVSIFDITNRLNPVFLKRLEPGVDLPVNYNIAHTLSPTVDGRFVMLGSWHSGVLAKIDTYDDQVTHIWGANDGLVMVHGIFTAGSLR
jgi:hypothetical protein